MGGWPLACITRAVLSSSRLDCEIGQLLGQELRRKNRPRMGRLDWAEGETREDREWKKERKLAGPMCKQAGRASSVFVLLLCFILVQHHFFQTFMLILLNSYNIYKNNKKALKI